MQVRITVFGPDSRAKFETDKPSDYRATCHRHAVMMVTFSLVVRMSLALKKELPVLLTQC
jgi:hypothetical protein